MIDRHFYLYQTNHKSYVIVDDGFTVSTSTISNGDKFNLKRGLAVAILRANIEVDHPFFLGHPLTWRTATGMCSVDDASIRCIVSIARAMMKIRKITCGKPHVWEVLDRLSSFIHPDNKFTRSTKYVPAKSA